GAPDLLQVLQRRGEVALGEHRAAAAVPQRVERLRETNAEGLQAARQLPPVLHLDHQVQVVLLDRVVEQREAGALLAEAEGALESAQSAGSSQARQSPRYPQHDVERSADLGAS